jgi:hypothetical protein
MRAGPYRGRLHPAIATNAADLKFLQRGGKLAKELQIEKRHARDQQKWSPVLRPVARQPKQVHDLFGEPEATSPDHALSYIC